LIHIGQHESIQVRSILGELQLNNSTSAGQVFSDQHIIHVYLVWLE